MCFLCSQCADFVTAGATEAKSVSDLVSSCDIVFSMVSDSEALRAVSTSKHLEQIFKQIMAIYKLSLLFCITSGMHCHVDHLKMQWMGIIVTLSTIIG